jgi:hypothetical protein
LATTAPYGENPPEQQSPQEPPRSQWLSTLPALIAALGAVGYGLFSVVLRNFYSQLGTTPEEVGWDASTVLVKFVPQYVLATLIVLWLIVGIAADTKRFGDWMLTHSTRALVVGVVIAAIVSYVLLFFFAELKEADISAGNPVRSGWDSVVPVATQCVGVVWIDERPQRLDEVGAFGEDKALQRLGHADGVVVLFDAASDSIIRIPSSDVVLVEVADNRCKA